MLISIHAIVSTPIGSRGFGFVKSTIEDVESDIFVHSSNLKKSGFTSDDFISGRTLELEIVQNPDGNYKAVRILQIEGASKHSMTSVDHYVNPLEVAKNTENGEVLWRIETAAGLFVRYIVTNLKGFLLRDLGDIRTKEAHVAIGVKQPTATKPKTIKRANRAA